MQPTGIPSSQPTRRPSKQPSSVPTDQPSVLPTVQPSQCPSTQPSSSPTCRPSRQPTTIPSTQPFANPTSAPVAAIYQTNEVLFWLGSTNGNKPQESGADDVLGTSYILFGRNSRHHDRFPAVISLGDVASREFVSEISKNEGAGIRHDTVIRSTTVIGDINGDSYLDLMVGYPLASKCSVYLGNEVDDFTTIVATTGESFAIIGDPYDGGGFLGWSSIRVGDLNSDGCDEILVSAISANTVYVIFGRKKFPANNVRVSELLPSEGFKIIGKPDEINFGISIALLHEFRKDSNADLAITAQRASAGQNAVYVLFGPVALKERKNVYVEQIVHNPNACFTVITPTLAFAGFSIAGIGDINNDGYDDLAIGSVPYSRGTFNSQITYVVYGRIIYETNGVNELHLSDMRPEDGFRIIGGGFLVTAVGDVNYDSINDMMITTYYDWKGQSCAYLITSPRNMSYSPSLQPSSFPSAVITPPPSLLLNITSNNYSHVPTFRPSPNPSFVPTTEPTVAPSRLVLVRGTSRPSAGKPSMAPTLSPTIGYHHLRGFSPTVSPTLSPTIAAIDYIEIVCDEPGDYYGMNESNYKFSVVASNGTVNIFGSEYGGAKNLYVLYCPSGQVNVVIENFRISTDMISLAHLVDDGYLYSSVNEVPHSLIDGPLTLPFCSNNRLQVILLSHSSFDLQEENFLLSFTENAEFTSNDSVLSQIQIGIVFGIVGFFLFIMYLTRFTDEEYKKAAIPMDVYDENGSEDPVSNVAEVVEEKKASRASDSESSSSSSSSSASLASHSSISSPRKDLLQVVVGNNGNQSNANHSNRSENQSNKSTALDNNVNITNDENKHEVETGKLETDRKVKEKETREKETNSSFSISSYLSSISLNESLPVEQKTEIVDSNAPRSSDHPSPSVVVLPPTTKNDEKEYVAASPLSDGSDSSSDSHHSICSSPWKPKNTHDTIERRDEQFSDISSGSSVLGLLFQDFDDGEEDDDEY
jgi:hypothetical protein